MNFRHHTVALAATGLCLFAACGSDDDEDSAGGDSAGSSKPAAFAITTSESGKKVTIDAPETIEAGLTEITLENAGKGSHDAQLVRVDGDQTAEQVLSEVLESGEGAPTPDWAHGAGGIGTTPGGQTGRATQVLEPGTYYLADTESSGGEGEGTSNAKNGGIVKFEVTGDAASAELPATDGSIVANEYSFEATGLKAGKNEITFDNTGKELHHTIAFPLNKGATLADAKKAFASEKPPSGPPPVDFEAGASTAVLDGGEKQTTELDLKKGKYVLLCFIADRAGGPPHVAKGMVSEATVE